MTNCVTLCYNIFDVRVTSGGPLKKRRLLQKALNSPKNMRFNEMVALAEAFGFRLSRVSGSHHIFVHPQVRELVNLQDVNGQAKPYQIRQFLQLVERYNLKLGDEP
jgi:predicted RNA binding protein YcfA (HicA-like mRNA interferase family)